LREAHTFRCIAAVTKHAIRRHLLVQLPQNWIKIDTISYTLHLPLKTILSKRKSEKPSD
jgi:hypothetical protein